RSLLEARFSERRTPVCRGDRAPPRGIRPRQGGGTRPARRPRHHARAREGRAGMTQPFEGVRVLDFTQVFAGPSGSYQLALLGADVIKVERPGGEDMRRSPLSREWADRNMASAFMSINANKRDLALDLTKPEAVEIIHRLARRADVVIENFRPGVMDKLG